MKPRKFVDWIEQLNEAWGNHADYSRYMEASKEISLSYEALLDASKKLAEALESYDLGGPWYEAREALASYSSFLKEQGVE
jgi:hypothetical protein